MRRSTLSITIFLLALSVVMADTPKEHHECPAPIGVMGEHEHKAGEMMLAYRFMTMNMQGLQSGTDAVETVDVLKDFMMTSTTMDMRMHMFGVMFAPHDKITFMGMTSYQQRHMEVDYSADNPHSFT